MKAVESALRGYRKTVPIEYAEFCYRREMGITYEQMQATPAWVIEQDMAFMSAEAKQRERDNKSK